MRLLFLLLSACILTCSGEEVKVRLYANPPFPLRNIFEHKIQNMDFFWGLKYWKILHNKGTAEEVRQKNNSFIRFSLNKGKYIQYYRVLPMSLFQKGEYYIPVCRIRPLSPLPVVTYHDGGPGFKLTFFSKDWKRSAVAVARTATGRELPGKWMTVKGKPFQVPEWAERCQLAVGFFYYNRQTAAADIDDIQVYPAYSILHLQAVGTQPLRQIKIVDEKNKNIFITPVLKGNSKTFRWSGKAEVNKSYCGMVIQEDGSAGFAEYPSKTTNNKTK